jgi:hypothetical protein
LALAAGCDITELTAGEHAVAPLLNDACRAYGNGLFDLI